MTVRPTVLGGILIAIIAFVAAATFLIWVFIRIGNRILERAEELLLVFQHNLGKNVARTDGDDNPKPRPTPHPRAEPTTEPIDQADAAEREWRERFGLKPDGLAS